MESSRTSVGLSLVSSSPIGLWKGIMNRIRCLSCALALAVTALLTSVGLPEAGRAAIASADGLTCPTDPSCGDFNECTRDACDPTTGTCRYDPVSCDDGNPCTTDVCFNGGGGCLSHGLVAAGTACDDGRSCTQSDVCDGSGHCVGQRQPEGSLCDDRNACTVSDLCDAGGACKGTTLPPGSACDDGDACTSGDTCTATAAGEVVCQAERRACDDGDPCTVDACDPATGDCVVAPKSCDDGNPCTNDLCDPATGTCLRSFASGGCEDGNLCTENDICDGGRCVAGTASGVSCHHAGNLCGVGRCFGSFCIVDSACDDLNPCTADSCVDPSVGTCVHSSLEGLTCEDDDRCTTGEICTDGTCGGGVPQSCDDGVDCTVDSCSQTYGCVHEPPPGVYDSDGDRVPDPCDNCVSITNADQADGDGDSVGNVCDNCPTIYNPDQSPEACLQTLVNVTIAYGALDRPGWLVSWTTTHEVTLLGFKIVSIDNQERVTSRSELIRCVECITGAGYTYSTFVPKYRSGRSVHVSMIDLTGTTIGTVGAVRIH
jgi:hypothetical protein